MEQLKKWLLALFGGRFKVHLIPAMQIIHERSYGDALVRGMRINVTNIDTLSVQARRQIQFESCFKTIEELHVALGYIYQQLERFKTLPSAGYIDSFQLAGIRDRAVVTMDDFLSMENGNAIQLEYFYDDILILLQAIHAIYSTLDGSPQTYYHRKIGHVLDDVYAWIEASI